MDTTYLDFELELGMGDSGGYPLSVIYAPAGNGRGVLHLPAAPLSLAGQVQNGSALTGQALGHALFDALFTHSGLNLPYYESIGMADGQGLRLRVKLRIVDPALAVVPWELLYDARLGEFVARDHATPVVRYAEVAQPIQPLTVTPPLHILGMAVDPTHTLDLPAEQRAVEQALQNLQARGLATLTWIQGGTWRDIQREMRRGPWHVFHFIGHGGFANQAGESGTRHLVATQPGASPAPGGGYLLLADNAAQPHQVTAGELGRLLAGHDSLRLVFLNACHGATSDPANLFSSAAATLMRRGVPAAIAMQFAILDAAGVELARTFYEALADGLPVEAALTDARDCRKPGPPQPVGLGRTGALPARGGREVVRCCRGARRRQRSKYICTGRGDSTCKADACNDPASHQGCRAVGAKTGAPAIAGCHGGCPRCVQQ